MDFQEAPPHIHAPQHHHAGLRPAAGVDRTEVQIAEGRLRIGGSTFQLGPGRCIDLGEGHRVASASAFFISPALT